MASSDASLGASCLSCILLWRERAPLGIPRDVLGARAAPRSAQSGERSRVDQPFLCRASALTVRAPRRPEAPTPSNEMMPVVADVSEHSSTPPAPVVDDANHHVDAARPAQPAGCAPLSHQAHAEMTSAKDPASVTEAAIERDVKTPESSDLHTPSHTVGVAARPLSRTLYRTDSTASTAIAEPSDLHHACEVSPRAPSTTSTPSPTASISPPTCSASTSASGLAPTPRSAVTSGEECGAQDASPAAMDADLPDEADVARMLLAFCSSAARAAQGALRARLPPETAHPSRPRSHVAPTRFPPRRPRTPRRRRALRRRRAALRRRRPRRTRSSAAGRRRPRGRATIPRACRRAPTRAPPP